MLPSEILNEQVASGKLKPDVAQLSCVAEFDRLQLALSGSRTGWLKRLMGQGPAAVRGIYLHGEVGRGKTMLMDLFYESVSATKMRVHFHGFMQQVHRDRAQLSGDAVISRIADKIANQARLMCLDEMQITDIADAMIVGRLFQALDSNGVCLVTTSNLPPEGLYKDGLNRSLFLPFIALLREKLAVVSLDGAQDYRLGRVAARDRFIVPPNPAMLDLIWNEMTDGAVGEVALLDVLGRKLVVPRAAHGCARFTFPDLCENPLGPGDYLALAGQFKTIFIDDIPQFDGIDRNVVKRFVLMIDTFYDAHVRLAASAAAEPDQLYRKGDHGFEFKRTASRLKEMRSDGWWQVS